MKLLLKYHADVRYEDDISLRYASENGHLEAVKLLLARGAVVNGNMLEKVYKNKHHKVLNLLVNNRSESEVTKNVLMTKLKNELIDTEFQKKEQAVNASLAKNRTNAVPKRKSKQKKVIKS